METKENNRDSTNNVCYLAEVLGECGSRSGLGSASFRKYMSTVTTSAILGGNTDIATKAVIYNVGAHASGSAILAKHGECVPTCDVAVSIGDYSAQDFAGAARRYVAFGGNHVMMDLAGAVERLGVALAVFTLDVDITCPMIRGGGHVQIIAAGGSVAPVVPATGHVWIPRCTDGMLSPNAFAALLAAVNGEGGTVVTDMLNLDNNGSVIVPEVNGYMLAEGCYHALRVLGSNYEQAGAGDVFAYALTRGVHKGLSVAGHSDEGAHMRTVLRAGRFQIPFGGVNAAKNDYVGLPRAMSFGAQSFVALIDSIALATAAAVGDCDPLIDYAGRKYPTVIVDITAERVDAGPASVDLATRPEGERVAVALNMANQIVEESGKFTPLYIKALMHIMGIGGNSHVAELHLQAAFTWSSFTYDRHLAHPAVAPWFWIEPTGLSRLPASEYPAVAAGYGHYVEPGSESEIALLPQARLVGEDNGCCGVGFEWRSARTVGALLHLNLHHQDGLANMIVRQADHNGFFLVGAGAPVANRIRNGQDAATYMWGRGHSMLPHPAEAIYVKGHVRALFRSFVYSNDNMFTAVPQHMFTSTELLHGSVRVRVTRPSTQGTHSLQVQTRSVSKLRTAASDALRLARRAFGYDMACKFMPQSVTGIVDEYTLSVTRHDPVLAASVVTQQPARGVGASSVHEVGTPNATQVGQSMVSASDEQQAEQSTATARGPPVVRSIVNVSLQGPQRAQEQQRRVPQVPGGGGTEQVSSAPETQ